MKTSACFNKMLGKSVVAYLSVLLFSACAGTGTMQIWKKDGITAKDERDNHIECGATPTGPSKVTVYEQNQKKYDDCMRAKGYKQEVVQATSTTRSDSSKMTEADARRNMSFNADIVKVDASCVDLWVFKVEEELFRNAVPAWFAYFLNNSQNRYTVHYDLKVRQVGKTYFGGYDETSEDEKSATVRPNEAMKLPVLEGKSGVKVVSLNIFRCTPDGRLTSKSGGTQTQTSVPAKPASTPSVSAMGTQSAGNSVAPTKNRALVKSIQLRLTEKGFYGGAADGAYGAMTKAAISKYQQSSNLPIDGLPSQELLTHLK